MKSKSPEIPGLPARLQQSRDAAGLSQAQAARLLGIHRPTLSNIESGDRKVTAGELKQFADLYKVSTSWLLGEEVPLESRIKLAARRLEGLQDKDVETVMRVIDSFRRNKK
jgi:transcriptional regulator with XRE-family HTH domain